MDKNIKTGIIISSFIIFIYIINYVYIGNIDNEIKKKEYMNNVVGTFFLVLGILKLYNLNKFVEIYSKYDIISKNTKLYGYSYPFIEILLGIHYLKKTHIPLIYYISSILILISIVSIVIYLLYGDGDLLCGCMGSFFNLPLSYVTITENIIMLIMIFYLL